MNKSALIRATPGKPADVVAKLAEQGVTVTLNLVKQVRRNERAKWKLSGSPSDAIRYLLGKGKSPAEIVKRLDCSPALVRQIKWQLANPEKVKAKAAKRSETTKRRNAEYERNRAEREAIRAKEREERLQPYAIRLGMPVGADGRRIITGEVQAKLARLMKYGTLVGIPIGPLKEDEAYEKLIELEGVATPQPTLEERAQYVALIAQYMSKTISKPKPKEPHQLIARSWKEIDSELDKLENE